MLSAQPSVVTLCDDRLEPEDFIAAFGETPTPYVARRIRNYDFRYRQLGSDERDACIRRIVDVLCNGGHAPAGEARFANWNEGWAAHLGQLDKDFRLSDIVPGYFGKYPVLRWQQQFIAPLDKEFEYHSLAVIEDWLFDKYLRDVGCAYEFGCGTGHNLFRIREVNPEAELWGLDWAPSSQQILARLGRLDIGRKISGRRFNLFAPDHDFSLAPDAAVLTVAALEQTADRFHPFVDYLLEQKPALCIHIEPIAELLDPENLLDSLSLAYFHRRNYLSGFLEHLRVLEAAGRLKIHLARRTSVGSMFIDGYSVVVWSPV
ncbi:MAG TPA: class I SAM-dependent methyltransferase [Stellaceae bacterium]